MIRATILSALAAILVGCGSDPVSAPVEHIPSGSEAPKTALTVVAGTKAVPVDTPVVTVSWVHQDSVSLIIAFSNSPTIASTYDAMISSSGVFSSVSGSPTIAPFQNTPSPLAKPSGSFSFKVIKCRDSIRVASIVAGTSSAFKQDSTWVYCK